VQDVRGNLRKALRPQAHDRAEWGSDWQLWSAFWGKVIRAVAALGDWEDNDLTLVREYVRRCRLARFHLAQAEEYPYSTSDTGYVSAHPGFAQSRADAKEARQLAVELGLTPAARRRAGVEVPVGHNASLETPETPADDQIGPDGKPL
jgi:phage terminase small subunit